MKKLLIFDMDGTLVDSSDSITNTINHVRSHHNLEPLEKSLLLENLNNPDINSAKFFYNTETFTPVQTKLFEEHYLKTCTHKLKLYDGIKELLEALRGEFKLSVATNANSMFAKRMLSYLEVEHLFDIIVGADMVAKSKPHPEMIHTTLLKLNHQHSSTLIGDSLKDLYAAQNANIDAILVNWGFSNHGQNGINSPNELYKKITTP